MREDALIQSGAAVELQQSERIDRDR